MTSSNQFDAALVERLVAEFSDVKGGLLPALHAVQEQLGFIPEQAVPLIADGLNLAVAEVHGVISYYHHFYSEQQGQHVVEVCQAEACQSMGARQLAESVKNLLGVDFHQTTADGKFSLEPVYCLGNCACAPSIKVGDKVRGRVSPDNVANALEQLTK